MWTWSAQFLLSIACLQVQQVSVLSLAHKYAVSVVQERLVEAILAKLEVTSPRAAHVVRTLEVLQLGEQLQLTQLVDASQAIIRRHAKEVCLHQYARTNGAVPIMLRWRV